MLFFKGLGNLEASTEVRESGLQSSVTKPNQSQGKDVFFISRDETAILQPEPQNGSGITLLIDLIRVFYHVKVKKQTGQYVMSLRLV